MVVTFNRTNKKFSCDCSDPKCIHTKIGMLVLKADCHEEGDNNLPETNLNNSANSGPNLDSIKRQLRYIHENKKIPYKIMDQDILEKPLHSFKEFTPKEEECFYCHGALVKKKTGTNAYVFTLNEKKKVLLCTQNIAQNVIYFIDIRSMRMVILIIIIVPFLATCF